MVVPKGELDLASVAAFQEELEVVLEGTGRKLLLDLSSLTFIDSSGIAVIYHAGANLAHFAVVVPPASPVAPTLETCGFRQVLQQFDSRAEALRALA